VSPALLAQLKKSPNEAILQFVSINNSVVRDSVKRYVAILSVVKTRCPGNGQVNAVSILGNQMKIFIKILLLSVLSTMAFAVLVLIVSKWLIPEFGLHLTYPFRLLRGTVHFEGETRGAEVFLIWERIILPSVFFTSALIFFLLRKK
jgi:hypothetical protein